METTAQGGERQAEMAHITAGPFEHYKGDRYLVLGLGHDSNHDGRTVVVYVPLYAAAGPRLAVRDLDDFNAYVHEDGSTCVADECPVIQDMLGTYGRVQTRRYDETHRPRFKPVVIPPAEAS